MCRRLSKNILEERQGIEVEVELSTLKFAPDVTFNCVSN